MNTMLADAVFAYLHFFGIGCLVAVLAAETVLVKAQMSAPTIAKLSRIDLGYGLAAALILGAGAARVAYGLKGPMFYMGNPMFWVKMGLFATTGLISIAPTLAFIGWRKQVARDGAFHPTGDAVARVRRLIAVQWVLLALIPLAAVLMARGIGT
jgi:putative membrane protein